ncbi:hypothetical protein SH2C18_46950 [Clostridium sediminicola]|uniref:hypothetical protein n=1 Tax=Clostridium sediminicola TaxID=3114879 RepID=UPI0031F1E91E
MGQVISLTIKGLKKDFKKNIIKALLVSIMIFILNFILLSKFQNSGLGPYLSSTLTISGNRLGGTLFWSLAGAFAVNIFSKIREKQNLFQLNKIKPVVGSMISFSKNESKLVYIVGIIIALVFSGVTGSASFSLMAALTLFSSSMEIKKSKLAFVLNIVVGKLIRAVSKNKGDNSISSLMSGSTFGFMLYGLFNGNLMAGTFGLTLIILFIIINIIGIFKRKKKNGEEI